MPLKTLSESYQRAAGSYLYRRNHQMELGGSDEPMVVIGREAGSGTRTAFEELLKVQYACQYAQELDSTGAVLAKVAATPGAIGYVSLDVVNDTVTAVSLNGTPAFADVGVSELLFGTLWKPTASEAFAHCFAELFH